MKMSEYVRYGIQCGKGRSWRRRDGPEFPGIDVREELIYPDSYPQFVASGRTHAELMEILAAVNLAYLPSREGGWTTRKEWRDVLSGGEKQRVSARWT